MAKAPDAQDPKETAAATNPPPESSTDTKTDAKPTKKVPQYRLLKHAGPFRIGEVVTAEQVKAEGADLQYWLTVKAIELVA